MFTCHRAYPQRGGTTRQRTRWDSAVRLRCIPGRAGKTPPWRLTSPAHRRMRTPPPMDARVTAFERGESDEQRGRLTWQAAWRGSSGELDVSSRASLRRPPRRKSFRSGGGGTTARRTRPVGDRALRAGHRGLACVCRTRPSPVVRAARAARQADFPPPRGQVAPTRNPPLGPWRSVTPMSLRHGRPHTYAKFLERPGQPAQPNERLKKTLRAPAPWKRA